MLQPKIPLDRFKEEQEYILGFTELMQRRMELDFGAINGIVNVLDKFKLIDRKDIPKISYDETDFDSDELKECLSIFRKLKPVINAEISKLEDHLSQIVMPENLFDVQVNSLAGETITYLQDQFGENPTDEIIQTQRILLRRRFENADGETVFINRKKGSINELIEYAIKATLYLMPKSKLNQLYNVFFEIEDAEVMGRLSRSDSEINSFRQGFITLTTIFDATVFDLVKIALHRDFFNLISLFGKKEKISLDRLNQFSSFDDFRNEIIEDQLKSKYLKEILIIINSHGVKLTDTMRGDEFINLLEMISRRNIHIHNRGIVDYKYLEIDENGKAKFNIYNFKSGEVAAIDSDYWEKVNHLCINCVEYIYQWVEGLSQ